MCVCVGGTVESVRECGCGVRGCGVWVYVGFWRAAMGWRPSRRDSGHIQCVWCGVVCVC